MMNVAASQSTELLALRVRLRCVGTMDEETDGRDHQQCRQIHLTRQEICPKNRSHPCDCTVRTRFREKTRIVWCCMFLTHLPDRLPLQKDHTAYTCRGVRISS
jgi:hypothetical protein